MSDDAYTPLSIDKALLDSLQVKRAGNTLPTAAIPLARIRAAQLEPYLLTDKEPFDYIVQTTLDILSLEQNTSGPTNLADNVSTARHIIRVYHRSAEYYRTCTGKQQK